jgi:hypothetical protein
VEVEQVKQVLVVELAQVDLVADKLVILQA